MPNENNDWTGKIPDSPEEWSDDLSTPLENPDISDPIKPEPLPELVTEKNEAEELKAKRQKQLDEDFAELRKRQEGQTMLTPEQLKDLSVREKMEEEARLRQLDMDFQYKRMREAQSKTTWKNGNL